MPGRPIQEPSASPASPEPGTGIAGYRVVRRIASGRRADLYLAAATREGRVRGGQGAADGIAVDGTTLVVLRVYRDDAADVAIGIESEVMDDVPGASPPALIDVATADDGSRILVVERIAGASVAQLLTERTLEPGEAVTLIAPIAAAVARLADRGFVHTRLAPSDVRLDESGRPRLLGLGAVERLPAGGADRTAMRREGLAALAGYAEAVITAVRPGGVFDDARALMAAALARRPFVAFEQELERVVFASATPAAVGGVAPARVQRTPARVLPPQATVEPTGLPEGSVDRAPNVRGTRLPSVAVGLLDVAEVPPPLIERVMDSVEGDRLAGIRVRLRSWALRRRRQIVVAALVGAAALVMLLTMVPPADARSGGDVDAAQSATEDAGARQEAFDEGGAKASPDASAPEPVDPGVAVVGDDPEAAASELLMRRAACFAVLDPECLATYVQAGSPIEESDWRLLLAARDGAPGIADLDADSAAVVAEMGAAVLVDVEAEGSGAGVSLLIVQSDAGWRLREIFTEKTELP
ncbi:hypothetical protein GCM10009761_09190 [Agromyces terreus]